MKFLLVDDNPENRFLISKTLIRKFPNAVLTECQSADVAVQLLQRETVTLIVAHRTAEVHGSDLVRLLREAAPTTPIIAVSSVDQSAAARAAGAARFQLLDQWLMLGQAAAEVLGLNHDAGAAPRPEGAG